MQQAKRMSRKSLAASIAALVASATIQIATPTVAATTLTAAQAAEHIGELATVCGVVASTRYASNSNRQPTFLNFDRPYPQQPFTVVIWGTERPKFGTPEATLMGRSVCATGMIQSYKGKPQIIATDPRQLVAK